MNHTDQQRGVSLIIALLVMILMLAAVLGLSTLLANQAHVVFNISGSQRASYAADTGIEKTLYYDKQQIPSGASEGMCNICTALCDANPTGTDCTSCKTTDLSSGGCAVDTCNNCKVTYTTDIGGVGGSVAVTATVTSNGGPQNDVCIESDGTYVNIQRNRSICYQVDNTAPPAAYVTTDAATSDTGGDIILNGSLFNYDPLVVSSATVYFTWGSANLDGSCGASDLSNTTSPQTVHSSGQFSATIDSAQMTSGATYCYQATADYDNGTLTGGIKSFTTGGGGGGSGGTMSITTKDYQILSNGNVQVFGSLNNFSPSQYVNSIEVWFAYGPTSTNLLYTTNNVTYMTASGDFNAYISQAGYLYDPKSALTPDHTYYYQAIGMYNGNTLKGDVKSFYYTVCGTYGTDHNNGYLYYSNLNKLNGDDLSAIASTDGCGFNYNSALLAVSPDNAYVYANSLDSMQKFDSSTLSLLATNDSNIGYTYANHNIVVSPDGNYVYALREPTGSQGSSLPPVILDKFHTVDPSNPSDKSVLSLTASTTLQAGRVSSLAISPGGDYLYITYNHLFSDNLPQGDIQQLKTADLSVNKYISTTDQGISQYGYLTDIAVSPESPGGNYYLYVVDQKNSSIDGAIIKLDDSMHYISKNNPYSAARDYNCPSQSTAPGEEFVISPDGSYLYGSWNIGCRQYIYKVNTSDLSAGKSILAGYSLTNPPQIGWYYFAVSANGNNVYVDNSMNEGIYPYGIYEFSSIDLSLLASRYAMINASVNHIAASR